MKSLSAKRIRLLHLIARCQRESRFPLVREMAAELGLAGESSVSAMLAALERDGYLKRQGGGRERRQRIYLLTSRAEAVVPNVGRRLPVLGTIRAGHLSEAIQECDEWIDPGDSLSVQPGDFLLNVEGDSMIGDNILPDDLVHLRPGIEIGHGRIAGVQVKRDGFYEATLKHLYREPDGEMIRLHASNPAYQDMVIAARDVEIIGSYRGLIRRMS